MTSGADALPSPKGNADDLVSVSQRLGQMRERAAQTVLVQRGPSDGAIRGTWTGEAAVARTAEATSLAGLIGEVADRLPVAGTALTTFGSAVEAATTAIEALQEEWDAAEAEYRSRLRSINTDPRYRDLPQEDLQSMADHYAGVRDDTHAELVRAWDRQMTTLREAEGAAAQQLYTLADATVPRELATNRLDVGVHLLDGLPLAHGQARLELAEHQAGEAGELLERAVGADGGALDQVAVDAFVAEYGDQAADPYFAYALMEELGAAGLTEHLARLTYWNNALTDPTLDPYQESMRALTGTLGTAFVTASGSRADADLDELTLQSVEQWRTRPGGWYDALQTAGREDYSLDGDLHGDTEGRPVVYGYQLQGQLLAAAANGQPPVSPGAGYMGTVGRDLILWDREMGEQYPYRANDNAHGDPYRYASLVHDGDGWDARLSLDPVHNLLVAAEHDGDGARALLNANVGTDGAGPTEEGYQSVVNHLLTERDVGWGTALPDRGDQLGRLVVLHGTDRTDAASTQLAGEFLNGYLDALDRSDTDGRDQSVFGEQNFMMRRHVADVAAFHIEDFLRTYGDHESTGRTFGEGEPGEWEVRFTKDDLDDKFKPLFAELARDPGEVVYHGGASQDRPALQRIVDAAVSTMSGEIRDGYATSAERAQDAAGRGAQLLADVGEGANDTLLKDAAAEDEYGQYMRSLVTFGAERIPTPPSVPGFVMSGGRDLLVEGVTRLPLIEEWTDTGHGDRATAIAETRKETIDGLLAGVAERALVEAAPWGDGPNSPAEYAAAREVPIPPEELFFDPGTGAILPLEEMTTEQRDHYDRFMSAKNLDRDGNPDVDTSPYIQLTQLRDSILLRVHEARGDG